jgi:hypothetical protein
MPGPRATTSAVARAPGIVWFHQAADDLGVDQLQPLVLPQLGQA